ncbi:hypothetical protein B9Z65_8806 [Elsinoe australis]|uniref:Uncharacterized protein n=1 Tax=Elsinoe australis TaxID=40998 RepID=A0A2P7YEV4_9PEZI|nr:hypothetical protein B9Z65_8806 [Elsinoe australis]
MDAFNNAITTIFGSTNPYYQTNFPGSSANYGPSRSAVRKQKSRDYQAGQFQGVGLSGSSANFPLLDPAMPGQQTNDYQTGNHFGQATPGSATNVPLFETPTQDQQSNYYHDGHFQNLESSGSSDNSPLYDPVMQGQQANDYQDDQSLDSTPGSSTMFQGLDLSLGALNPFKDLPNSGSPMSDAEYDATLGPLVADFNASYRPSGSLNQGLANPGAIDPRLLQVAPVPQQQPSDYQPAPGSNANFDLGQSQPFNNPAVPPAPPMVQQADYQAMPGSFSQFLPGPSQPTNDLSVAPTAPMVPQANYQFTFGSSSQCPLGQWQPDNLPIWPQQPMVQQAAYQAPPPGSQPTTHPRPSQPYPSAPAPSKRPRRGQPLSNNDLENHPCRKPRVNKSGYVPQMTNHLQRLRSQGATTPSTVGNRSDVYLTAEKRIDPHLHPLRDADELPKRRRRAKRDYALDCGGDIDYGYDNDCADKYLKESLAYVLA